MEIVQKIYLKDSVRFSSISIRETTVQASTAIGLATTAKRSPCIQGKQNTITYTGCFSTYTGNKL